MHTLLPGSSVEASFLQADPQGAAFSWVRSEENRVSSGDTNGCAQDLRTGKQHCVPEVAGHHRALLHPPQPREPLRGDADPCWPPERLQRGRLTKGGKGDLRWERERGCCAVLCCAEGTQQTALAHRQWCGRQKDRAGLLGTIRGSSTTLGSCPSAVSSSCF